MGFTCRYSMINDLTFANDLPQLQIIGAVITIFGIAIFALALRRKHLRSRVQGLQKFAISDRAPFSKRSENTLQKIGFILFLVGILTVTVNAVKESNDTMSSKDTTFNSTSS